MVDADDTYDLNRFVQAQADTYQQALSEVRAGRKRSHWMWYIFPQFDGLGFSSISHFYSIKSIPEAEAYLRHPVLGPRLVECCEAVIGVNGQSAHDMFGLPDEMKLRSCATLFAYVSGPDSVFERLLSKYFGGLPDERTIRPIGAAPEAEQDQGNTGQQHAAGGPTQRAVAPVVADLGLRPERFAAQLHAPITDAIRHAIRRASVH